MATSEAVAATRSRTAKVTLVADALRAAGPEGARLAAFYLSGTLPQRRTGIGWRSLAELPAPAGEASLELGDVDEALEEISALSGAGSAGRRRAAVQAVFAAATEREQRFLRGLLTGEVRQGALDGVLQAAIAEAADVPAAAVRRAVMLAGWPAPVAQAALENGEEGLARIGLVVGRPLRPMLAGSEPDVPAALAQVGKGRPVAIERKLDGIRVQAHKLGDEVRLFTRSLDEITERLPEVVDVVRRMPAQDVVLDAEAIALRPDGAPHPFQVTGARTASRSDPAALAATTPVTTFVFDVLHVSGEDLLDAPASERFARLATLLPEDVVVPRVVTDDAEEAAEFFAEQVTAGHEGVVVKSLDAPYAAGRRGAGWVKVKPRHTLDLVVLAIEWGSGRRRGMLSNIHLGARDESSPTGFVMLGKTFKGMTDEMLEWQTRRFLDLETGGEDHVVHVRPEQVVEIAFDGLQTSRRYPAGLALRFARVLRYRDDKTAAEADTIETVRSLAHG
ncbi:DNA ligase B [Mobilicoccus caccae]|uniref:DNA ligase n=1 Tax=Mobilicoccus caccae TaxID=1859295 RepID=A0ABQ6IZ98_9MICO|nr:DNA ligase B [Mobilicoccus caccae]